ncbi:YqzH family protein [Bacillus sp. UNC322MFChir4.1]|uniref:YqzH family protein n=1 Tax=Bacillus sp. UNC322MFChir4.1 TaxID=1449045 RepID=UPI00054D56C9|nr:YqzH family protein [Bacillus sp. UNC322MFChir4.1]
MNEKLIEKMITKSFQQYQCAPTLQEDYKMLIERIQNILSSNTEVDLYEAIEDVVYEYITLS